MRNLYTGKGKKTRKELTGSKQEWKDVKAKIMTRHTFSVKKRAPEQMAVALRHSVAIAGTAVVWKFRSLGTGSVPGARAREREMSTKQKGRDDIAAFGGSMEMLEGQYSLEGISDAGCYHHFALHQKQGGLVGFGCALQP